MKILKVLDNTFSIICTTSLMIGLIFTSCGSLDGPVDEGKYQELQEIVNSKEFQIENNWALPVGGGNINLIGNPNHIIFKEDSVDIFLPYFGVSHTSADYGGSEIGIKYNGTVQDLQIKENSSKGNIELEFDANDESENFNFIINVYPNKKTRTRVSSSRRNTISYEGEITETEIKEE